MPADSQILVSIMTYNEVDNLPVLVEKILAALPEAQILVVDDNSPDGTGTWCDEFANTSNQLRVIHRRKERGLGSATIAALQWGIENQFEKIATIDADLSHDPAALATMNQRLDRDKTGRLGVVIGSRYVPGGKIKGWPWHRRWTSRVVNGYARTFLALTTRDNTSALRIYRSSALQRIDLNQISSRGYSYLEEILWRMSRARIQMDEVPIEFVDRQTGHSKANLKVVTGSCFQLLRMGSSQLVHSLQR